MDCSPPGPLLASASLALAFIMAASLSISSFTSFSTRLLTNRRSSSLGRDGSRRFQVP